MKKILRRFLKDDNGQILIAVIALMAVGSLVVIPSLYLASTTINAIEASRKTMDAFYAADAGVEYALYQISYTNTAVSGSPYNLYTPNNVYGLSNISALNVTIAGGSNTYTVTANVTLTGGTTKSYSTTVVSAGSAIPYTIVSISSWH